MVRQRRRGHNRYIASYNDNMNKILLSEFRFYNKIKKVIDEKVLEKIQKQLKKSKPDKEIRWTNNEFAKHGIGFTFTKSSEITSLNELFIEINEYDASFSVKGFITAKDFIRNKILVDFKLNDTQRGIVDDVTYSWSNSQNIPFIKNWADLVDLLIKQKLLNKRDGTPHWEIFYNDYKELFNNNRLYHNYRNCAPAYNITRERYRNINLYHIFDVVEKRLNNKNYRIASVFDITNNQFCFNVIDENNDYYNYFDKDIIFFEKDERKYFSDIRNNEYDDKGVLCINIDMFNVMKNNINDLLTSDQHIIPQMIYNFYSQRFMSIGFDDDESKLSMQEAKINDQYKKLLSNGKTIKFDNIVINKNIIEVIGERFKIEFKEDFLDVIEDFYKVKKIMNIKNAEYNFNILYERLLMASSLNIVNTGNSKDTNYKDYVGTTFKVNDMNIEVIKNDSNRFYINKIFCRVDDVVHILNRAICFNNVDEFNKYIKDVSYIGIDWKRMISSGINIQLKNPFYSIFKKIDEISLEALHLRFSMIWDDKQRNKIYLILNGEKYLIKYKGKFKNNFNSPKRIMSMYELKKELSVCLEKIDDDIILEIVENAIEEAKIILRRGQELVQNTIIDVKAEKIEVEIDQKTRIGYTFFGRQTKRKYFIDGISLEVYLFENNNWDRRCINDDASKHRIFEDKLANRLINIYNEPQYLKNFLGIKS